MIITLVEVARISPLVASRMQDLTGEKFLIRDAASGEC
jgi:hypothetical protein